MSRVSLFIRLLLALCLLAATFNHLRAALDHGLLWDYGYGVDTPLAWRGLPAKGVSSGARARALFVPLRRTCFPG